MSAAFILGIETSNPTAGPTGPAEEALLGPGVALMAPGGEIVSTEALREGSRHDDALMPAIQRLFARVGATPQDVARVAVSAGPGGYTGLRIAVTTAKMVAEATGCEVVAVPSACVAAWRLTWTLAPAIVCLASKKGAAHATLLPDAAFVRDRAEALHGLLGAEGLRQLQQRVESHAWIGAATPLGLIDGAALGQLQPRSLIADRYLPEPMREAATSAGIQIVEPQFAAESVCRIGARLPAQSAADLLPIYAREADAVTQWRARKGDAAR